MIALPPLKQLREIDGRLQRLSLQVELMYAALGDHCETALPSDMLSGRNPAGDGARGAHWA